MTDEQILIKAIEKAVRNGWKPLELLIFDWDSVSETFMGWKIEMKHKRYYSIIFSHDFAKAFWGEEEKSTTFKGDIVEWEHWEYHLAKMVLEEEPLKYIEKFLKEK